VRAALTIRAILRRVGGALGFRWFTPAKPAPLTINEPWREAVLAARRAKACKNTRAMHAARQVAQRLAHEELAGSR